MMNHVDIMTLYFERKDSLFGLQLSTIAYIGSDVESKKATELKNCSVMHHKNEDQACEVVSF